MKPGKNLTLGSLLMLAVFALASVGFYAGARLVEPEETAAADDGLTTPGGPADLRLVASALKFDKTTLTASTGVQVTVTLDNQDAGVLHNVAFYTNNRATQAIDVGELFPGPGVRTDRFTAPGAPGNYFFRCDVHPDTMRGTFAVK